MGNFGKIVSATNLSEADKTVRTGMKKGCGPVRAVDRTLAASSGTT
jgi:hypothetical protein